MFGDTEIYDQIAERLLETYTLEEMLEMNDLTPEDVLSILIERGYIGEPSRDIAELEGENTGEED